MRIMEPYDSFRFYQSIKLHFESDSYDAIKYNYKTSVKPQSFWKRRDKYFFAKVGKKFDDASELVRYYVSYFIQDKNWIGDMLDDDDTYRLYQKRIQSLGYIFEQDLNKLAEIGNFDQVLDSSDGHPQVIISYMSDDINIETVVILNQLTGFMNKADKEITETIVWPEVSRKIRKYSPFVSYDLEKAKNIVLRVFTQ